LLKRGKCRKGTGDAHPALRAATIAFAIVAPAWKRCYTGFVIHSIAQLREGLVVSQAVRDPRGQILLPAGAILTTASIAQLAGRGVQAVDVDAVETPEEREARIAAETARLDEVLPPTLTDPALLQLRTVLMEALDA